jgi:hypothetical protein
MLVQASRPPPAPDRSGQAFDELVDCPVFPFRCVGHPQSVFRPLDLSNRQVQAIKKIVEVLTQFA